MDKLLEQIQAGEWNSSEEKLLLPKNLANGLPSLSLNEECRTEDESKKRSCPARHYSSFFQ